MSNESGSVSFKLTARLPFVVEKKAKWYLAGCSVLDVYSQGNTEEEAVNNLKEAVSLFLETCIEMGTLYEVMKKCGFQIFESSSTTEKKYKNRPNEKMMDVPLELFYEQMKGQPGRCHA